MIPIMIQLTHIVRSAITVDAEWPIWINAVDIISIATLDGPESYIKLRGDVPIIVREKPDTIVREIQLQSGQLGLTSIPYPGNV